MPNSMKVVGDSGHLGLQVTRPVRDAGLVEELKPEERAEDENPPYPNYRAAIRIHAFDGLILILDRDRVAQSDAAELVAHAIEETQTVFSALNAIVSIMGQGYMVQLPNGSEAGFEEGDTAPVQVSPNILVIHNESDESVELATELASMRETQVS
ncbi:hypothetical protein [Halorussus sp. AFM4]|uniref:hypothetical protein n=1 Tax=Halorussus sp. AFM4 TaxID=3421651 RepID=UPI003EC09F02